MQRSVIEHFTEGVRKRPDTGPTRQRGIPGTPLFTAASCKRLDTSPTRQRGSEATPSLARWASRGARPPGPMRSVFQGRSPPSGAKGSVPDDFLLATPNFFGDTGE